MAIGPKIADASVGGSQISGRFIILGICSMEVPIPWAKRPPTPLSLKLVTANPIIWQQHPIVAAPAATPFSPRIIPRAAELIGKVSTIPMMTETTIPIRIGCCSVPQFTRLPSHVMKLDTPGPTSIPTAPPERMVIAGVIRRSSFVFPATSLPIVIPTYAATNAPRGSPGPDNTNAPVSDNRVPAIRFDA